MAQKEQSDGKVRFLEKFGFGMFGVSNNIVYQFRGIHYLFFLTNALRMDTFWAGMVLTIGTIWDAVNDPLIGFYTVNRKFRSGERVRPYAFWYAIPWAVTVILLFSDFGLSGMAQVAAAVIVYILFEVFNTFVAIPYNSMAGLATPLDSERRSINVYRNLGAGGGSVIGGVAALPLLKLFGGLDTDGNLIAETGTRGFFLVTLVLAVIIIAGSGFHYATTRERVRQQAEDEKKLSLKQVAVMLFRCKSWVLNTVYIVCYGTINLLLMSCLNYYATYVLHSTEKATIVMLAYLVGSLIASFLVSAVDKKLGRRKTMTFAAGISIVGKFWFVANPFSVGAIFVNAFTVGIAITFAFVLFNTNRNNIVDIIESKHGRRIDSMIASTDNLASKLAVALATQLLTIALSRAGHDPSLPVQPDAVITAINLMLGWIPLIASIIMALVAWFMPIEREYKEAKALQKFVGARKTVTEG
ncbi:MAG: glycoside-pentoside-hexuronide (GPH):cation symporter [Oscillospiraceae bacterium]|jgi:sugar (glycoside-pentoside-hexuronide) transporter|nr:glycoside-pentoside-hexuronide (GPH):cation symporter [Oscillospiraceae bacterium]